MELNSKSRLRRNLLIPFVEVAALLGVREVLNVSDLVLSVLFNESKNAESIVFGLVVFGSGVQSCELRVACQEEIIWWSGIDARTWTMTFPGASITSWIMNLSGEY
jgi:hypothetical protein